MPPTMPNPYATPSVIDAVATQGESAPVTSTTVLRSLARWALVCGVSAGSSFFLALSIGYEFERIAAMLLGILTFILAYTYVDLRHVRAVVSRYPGLRTTLWIGYGTRMLISILPPVGAVLDIPCGLISVGLVGCIPGFDSAFDLADGQELVGSGVIFAATYLTTLVQGVCLNLVLLAYMAFVYAFIVMIRSFRDATVGQRSS